MAGGEGGGPGKKAFIKLKLVNYKAINTTKIQSDKKKFPYIDSLCLKKNFLLDFALLRKTTVSAIQSIQLAKVEADEERSKFKLWL